MFSSSLQPSGTLNAKWCLQSSTLPLCCITAPNAEYFKVPDQVFTVARSNSLRALLSLAAMKGRPNFPVPWWLLWTCHTIDPKYQELSPSNWAFPFKNPVFIFHLFFLVWHFCIILFLTYFNGFFLSWKHEIMFSRCRRFPSSPNLVHESQFESSRTFETKKV